MAILGATRPTLRTYVKQGRLNQINIPSRKVRFDADEVRYLACIGTAWTTRLYFLSDTRHLFRKESHVLFSIKDIVVNPRKLSFCVTFFRTFPNAVKNGNYFILKHKKRTCHNGGINPNMISWHLLQNCVLCKSSSLRDRIVPNTWARFSDRMLPSMQNESLCRHQSRRLHSHNIARALARNNYEKSRKILLFWTWLSRGMGINCFWNTV